MPIRATLFTTDGANSAVATARSGAGADLAQVIRFHQRQRFGGFRVVEQKVKYIAPFLTFVA